MAKHPFRQLWQFHQKFKLFRKRKPNLPDQEIRNLRIKLLEEEYNEYLEGERNNDLENIAKELTDIIYIAYGTGVAYGLPMIEIFEEVHKSNLSKLGSDGKPVYREDGKVTKGPNYNPPDLKSIIDTKRWEDKHTV